MALLMPLSQVGVFAASINALAAATIVLFEFNKATVVEYSRSRSDRPSLKVHKASRVHRLLAFVAALAMIGLAPPFVAFALPPEYSSATAVLVALAFGLFALGLYDLPLNFLVYSEGKTGLAWVPSAIGALALVAGALLLAPSLGALGGGIAVAVSYATMAAGSWVTLLIAGARAPWRQLGISWRTLAALLAGLAPAAASVSLALPAAYQIVSLAWGVACGMAVGFADRKYYKKQDMR